MGTPRTPAEPQPQLTAWRQLRGLTLEQPRRAQEVLATMPKERAERWLAMGADLSGLPVSKK